MCLKEFVGTGLHRACMSLEDFMGTGSKMITIVGANSHRETTDLPTLCASCFAFLETLYDFRLIRIIVEERSGVAVLFT